MPRALAEQVAAASQRLRDATTCSSRPASPRPSTGPARCIELGARDLDTESAATTLGAVLKYREDADRVQHDLDRLLAG